MKNPRDTVEFLLGELWTGQKALAEDISIIMGKQRNIETKIDSNSEAVKKEIEAINVKIGLIEKSNAYAKGKTAGIAVGAGGVAGGIITAIIKFLT